MKNRKIFVDCHIFDKGFQGTRTYIQGLYLELIKDKYKHFYFASSNNDILKNTFGIQDNITFLKYHFNNPVVRLLFEIPYMIFKNKIDFAHFQYRVPPIKLCKYIVTIHDVLFEDFPKDFPKATRIQNFITYKYSAKISDILFTVSEYSKHQIEKHLRVKNVIFMPNGVDAVFFEDYDKKEVQKMVFNEFGLQNYLIYVSRWEPRKNHHLVLKSFINLKLYENYHLVFIGDETFKNKEYENLFLSLDADIKAKIITLKKIEFSKMLLLLRGATVSVYPSRAEGFGIPPLESIAAKVPTICSNSTAMADFDFFEEYFFNPSIENDLNEKLKTILKNNNYNIEYKRNCIKQRYNWRVSASIYNKSLEKFIGS
jgi:glycosyltransferase involved in cell wall biosynthesis